MSVAGPKGGFPLTIRDTPISNIATISGVVILHFANGVAAQIVRGHLRQIVAAQVVDRQWQNAGKRLPTEAQWMASAGGGASNPWPWGPEFLPEKANLWGDRDGSLGVAKVGSYPQGASPYGVMDTVGNVWEWVSDSYVAPGNDSKKVRLRIVKGGGWTSAKRQAGISSRNIVDPEIKNPTIGFRCAKQF